jgi:Fuc2NAc and GlcNAc transferase
MSEMLDDWSIVTLSIAALVAWSLTGWLAATAVRRGMLDRPNERSSHSVPTPRGGGLAIVVAIGLLASGLVAVGVLSAWAFVALLPPFFALAAVGWADDRGGVAPQRRLAVHLASAGWCLGWCAANTPWASALPPASWPGVLVLLTLALTLGWAINLFNFMDGIDGIAGAQGVFIGLGGALLLLIEGGESAALLMLVVAGACAGFLAWNWSPARIFMGDVGSGALGFLLAATPLVAIDDLRTDIWPWLILWGSFLVDASVTLVRRGLRGQALHQAHRTHAYQWLSRRWQSHRAVSLAYLAINVAWLAPWAVLAAARPSQAPVAAIVALGPLVPLAAWLGAGRPEQRNAALA